MKDNSYEIIKVDATDDELEKYKECFEKNGTERDLDNLKWLHQQNPVKDDMIYYALKKDKDDIASIYTALPMNALINGHSTKAMQSIDTLTDKDHRGKGLFISLAKKLYMDAAQSGYAFVYGFPNENSAPGFFKKLEWISFGEAPFLIKPLKLSYFLKKFFKRKTSETFIQPLKEISAVNYKNGLVIKNINEFGNDYDKLWQAVSKKINLVINRNASYMNWRFVNKPGEYYHKFGIYNKNDLEAIIIFTVKNKHDGIVAYIMEFLFYSDKKTNAEKLLRFATKIIRSQKADVILAWCLPQSFNLVTYKKAGYFKLPEFLRPQKLYLGVKIIDPQFSETISNLNNWYISYADSDTV